MQISFLFVMLISSSPKNYVHGVLGQSLAHVLNVFYEIQALKTKIYDLSLLFRFITLSKYHDGFNVFYNQGTRGTYITKSQMLNNKVSVLHIS